MPKPVQLCATQHSAVYVCRVCGARDVGTTRAVALTAAAVHYERAHPTDEKAAEQLRRRARLSAANKKAAGPAASSAAVIVTA